MRHLRQAASVVTVLILAGCGGSRHDEPAVQNRVAAMVSFGDSLSDVGTYAVGTVKKLGGGRYTVNGPEAKNWTELIAARLNLPAPCAARTGLDGDNALGFRVATVDHPGCMNYAQGGARVTDPVGPGNKALGGGNALVGQLTNPLIDQINRHLTTAGGSFKGTELVTVFAGGNDIFANLTPFVDGASAAGSAASAAAAAAPGATPEIIRAATEAATLAYTQANTPLVVAAMATAATQLGGYVNNLLLAKGATHVAVVNLPDASLSPFGQALDETTRAIVENMVTTFNGTLQATLGVNSRLLYIDAYSTSRAQFAAPAQYGLSNVTRPACDLLRAKNLLGSALICTTDNLVADAKPTDAYADTVHPTPYGYRLLADLVAAEMTKRGWL
ncbi:MAG: SGNH/GDSL hydrolase family protein [Herminiimonas sp.]|nr:SGNH/GDSL hydrolase family protein [Herminiimonas sp.]